MRWIWAPAALAVIIAAFLWSRHQDRASSPRAATKETEGAGTEGTAAVPGGEGGRTEPGPDTDPLRRDYLVAGRAADGSGRAVPDAKVFLRQGCGDVSWGDTLEATTAADGRFKFEGVAEGPCELTVQAKGFAVADADVTSGDVSVEVVLRRGASVEGMVVDPDGRAVAARVFRISDPRMMPSGDYQSDDVDASGRFQYDGRNPGTLGLRAVTEDGREGEVVVEVREGNEIRDVRIEVAPPWRSHLRVRALVAKGSPRDVWFACHGDGPRVQWEGEVATLLFRDPPGTSMPLCVTENGYFGDDCRSSDRVLKTAALADPAVIDVLLPELVPVRVETDPPLPDLRAKFSHFVDKDRKKDGSWLLSPECPYSAEVSAEGFLPVEVQHWRPPAGGGVLKVQLRRGAVVRGVVLDAQGTPVEGAKFNLGESDATAGPDGRFALVGLPEGEHVLIAHRDHGFLAATRVLVESGGVTDAGTLIARPWQTVRGRVLDESRRPVGGASVTFVGVIAGDRPPASACWSYGTYSHANGAYEIVVPSMDGFFLVEKRGYGTTPARPDQAEEIVLPRPAFVRVDATGAAGSEGVLWTCSVRWPDLVPDAIWDVDRFLPCTVEVAPGRIEVIVDLYDEPEPRIERRRVRTVEAAQGQTAEVAFER